MKSHYRWKVRRGYRFEERQQLATGSEAKRYSVMTLPNRAQTNRGCQILSHFDGFRR